MSSKKATGNKQVEPADQHVLDMSADDTGESGRNEIPAFQQITRSYLESLRNIFEATKIVVPHLAKWLKDEIAKTERKIDRYIPDGQSADKVVFENARDMVEFSSALNRWDRLQEDKSLPLLLRSLFIQVFCEFDAFMGRLLKQIYLQNPDLLKGISREISLVDLLEYEDIESASRAMLEKEIETFRRDSYIEQFAQLEKKFSLTLRKFPEWPQLVELSQRRNLLVHNDGVVNDQYVSICRREGCQLNSDVKVGIQLSVLPADIAHVLRILSKVGYMLSHTLWSKVFPKEVDDVQRSLNDILYECLEDKRWRIAAGLGDFALSEAMKKRASEIDLKVRIINTAIAMKFAGEEAAAQDLLSSQDWSASYRDFKLALLVLQDKFEEAIALMRQIGKSGEMLDQHAYHAWPLFEKFREREEFYAVYQEIYGEPYQSEANDLTAEMAGDAKKELAEISPKKHSSKRSVSTVSPKSKGRKGGTKGTKVVKPA